MIRRVEADIGTVVAGLIRDGASGNYYIDLDATGSEAWLYSPSLEIRADGYCGLPTGAEMAWGGVVSGVGTDYAGGVMKTGDSAGGGARGIALTDGLGTALLDVSGNRALFALCPTADFAVVDSGTASATEAGWVEVTIGGSTMYLRAFSAK